MRRLALTFVVVAGAALAAACSVPDASFVPSVDSGIDAPSDHHLELDPADLSMGEGETRTVTIRAVPPPEQAVEVALTAGDGLAFPGPSTVAFTAGQETATFDVSALEDDDAEDGEATLTANLLGYDSASSSVHVDDDEVLEIALSPDMPITIRENTSASVEVTLTAKPTHDVNVTVGTGDMSVARVSNGLLTFGADDWNVPQSIDVIGVRDADVLNEDVAITFDSPPLPPRSLTVHVNDIDRQNIVVDESAIDVHEGDPVGGALHVSLAQQPAADIMVNVAPQDPRLHVSATVLTFTPANFGMPQAVAVTADGDDDVAGFTSAVRFDAVDIDTPVSIAAHVIDDDHQQIVVAAVSPFQVTEGQDATFTARLRFRPADDTMVGVMALDGSVATTSTGALTFTTSGAQAWNLPQTVTVHGVSDDDTLPGSTKIRLATPNVPTVDLDTTVLDDDRVDLALAGVPPVITEGMSGSFTVALTHQPVAPLTVMVTSNDSALTAPAQPLSFTLANWATPQTVMLPAPADADLISEQVTITLTPSDDTVLPRTLTINVNDTTQQGIVTTTSAVNNLAEGGATTTVGVSLSNPPVGSVTLMVSSSSTQVTASAPSGLTFGPADWNTPKPVVLTALADDDVVGGSATITLRGANLPDKLVSVTTTDPDHVDFQLSAGAVNLMEESTGTFTVALTHKPTVAIDVTVATDDAGAATPMPASFTIQPNAWNQPVTVTVRGVSDDDLANETTPLHVRATGITAADLTANVTDDDHQAIVLANTPAALTEGMPGSAFTVALAFRPAVTVTIDLATSDQNVLSLNHASLMFNSNNWNVAQSVTVSAPIDADTVDGSGTITASTASPAPNNAPPRSFDVTVHDPDVVQIVSSDANVAVTEHAAGKPISVHLSKQPTGTVRVSATSDHPLLTAAQPGSHDFTAGNWNQDQVFTINALDDDDTAGGNAVITLSSPAVMQSVPVNVTVTDPDQQAIQLTAANPFTVNETGTRTFNVHLRYRPTGNFSVALAYDGAVVGLAPAGPNLVFNDTNWQTGIDVTVTPVHDVDMADSSTMITASAGALSASLTVAIHDTDVQTIITSAANVNVVEGSTATFNVKLDRKPAANTQVVVSSGNGNKLSVSGNLTFTPASYNVNQAVTVTGLSDSDTADELVTVTLTNADAPNAATVQVSVDDQTIITDLGWPTYFGTAGSVPADSIVAFKVTVASAGKLDAFGVVTGAAGSDAKMALYRDTGGVPDALVASVDTPVTLVAGTNLLDATDTPLAAGSYWVALRVAPAASVGLSTQTGPRCVRTLNGFASQWPASFGSASCVAAGGLLNMFVRTYRP
ncbi:MAG TPA: hypothetical protein VHE35_18995 [Kofleriaceae bacterium]|nr:hypothetical protein [Kofleriaceae bacterium]